MSISQGKAQEDRQAALGLCYDGTAMDGRDTCLLEVPPWFDGTAVSGGTHAFWRPRRATLCFTPESVHGK